MAEYSAERARLLFGQFRKGDAADPETYTAAIAAVLADYPEDIVQKATDPRTGLGATSNWLPTVKEVHDFCQEAVEARSRAADRAAAVRLQVAGRQEYEKIRKKAPVRATLQAKGFLKEKPVEPIDPEILRHRFEQAQQLYGKAVNLSPEAKAHLAKAGYSA